MLSRSASAGRLGRSRAVDYAPFLSSGTDRIRALRPPTVPSGQELKFRQGKRICSDPWIRQWQDQPELHTVFRKEAGDALLIVWKPDTCCLGRASGPAGICPNSLCLLTHQQDEAPLRSWPSNPSYPQKNPSGLREPIKQWAVEAQGWLIQQNREGPFSQKAAEDYWFLLLRKGGIVSETKPERAGRTGFCG